MNYTMLFLVIMTFVVILVVIFIYFKTSYNKKINMFYEKFDCFIKDIDTPLYYTLDKKIFTNIDASTIDKLKENIRDNYMQYKNYSIIRVNDNFYLKTNIPNFDIKKMEKQKSEIEELQKQLKFIKDKNYFFYKEFINKLIFLLKEVDDVKNLYFAEKDSINQNDIENFRSKLKFLINFFKEKGTAQYYKYNICNIILLKEYFQKKFIDDIYIDEVDNIDIYVEEEKVKLVLETIIYSLLKSRTIREKIKLVFKIENDKLNVKITVINGGLPLKNLLDEEFLSVINYESNIWNLNIEKDYVNLDVLIKRYDSIDKIDSLKMIILDSNFTNIREVEKNILYDMENYGFCAEDIRDMKLIIDEIIINSIEHGNRFDYNKKVIIVYKFSNHKSIMEIEVEDEGDGFDTSSINFEKMEEPDIFGERGRGIYIIKQLTDDLKYFNNGKKIYIKKVKK
ncbi:MAG: ATP-binding protein [Fusobacteria bacterium]|nr:ATP-binding protein [Fusobacteriota bacterium]